MLLSLRRRVPQLIAEKPDPSLLGKRERESLVDSNDAVSCVSSILERQSEKPRDVGGISRQGSVTALTL
jgi:hypothetical protein